MNGTIETAITNYAVSEMAAPVREQIVKIVMSTGTKMIIVAASLFGIKIAPSYFKMVSMIVFGVFSILSVIGILELIQVIFHSIS